MTRVVRELHSNLRFALSTFVVEEEFLFAGHWDAVFGSGLEGPGLDGSD